MELTPVKSSSIAGAEYLAGDQVMLVRYHNGSLYARLLVTPAQYVGFMAAPSKGGFVAAMPNRAILISRKEGARIEEETSKAEQGAVEGQAAAPLNLLDEEADPCCRKHFAKTRITPSVDVVSCPECGSEFYPEMVGPVRYWHIKVVIVRTR